MALYSGFTDGASRHSLNFTSATWVLYFPIGDLISLGGSFLGLATNNIAKYHAVIGLLIDPLSNYVS